jgi:signal transduction histidine kinase
VARLRNGRQKCFRCPSARRCEQLRFARLSAQLDTIETTPTVDVRIEGIEIDHHHYTPLTIRRVPPKPRETEFDYTALSLVEPRAVQFKYRLFGHDEQWQNPGLRRQAFYNDLGPGHYRFQVIASNNDGVWNNEGASFDFDVLPAFYQTLWFRTLCILLGGLILWWVYAVRLKRVTQLIILRSQERLREREDIARDLHDTFFQSVQSLFLRFHTITMQIPKTETVRDTLEEVLNDSDRVMMQGRETFLDIRTADDPVAELSAQIAEFGAEFSRAHPIAYRVVREGQPRDLNPLAACELSRIAREALYNAFRHSEAKSIEVEVSYDATYLRLRFRDDGKGFEPDSAETIARQGHCGLRNMKQRAERLGAKFCLWSRTGSGTEVEVIVPAAFAYTNAKSDGAFSKPSDAIPVED